MKRLRIGGIFRLRPLPFFAFVLGFFFALFFLIGGITGQNELALAIGILLALLFTVGLGFFFSSGITLTKRFLFVIAPDTLRVVSLRRIRRLRIEICEDSLSGTVILYDAAPYRFFFTEYDLGDSRFWPLKRFLTIPVRITPQQASRFEKAFSLWDRALIKNSLVKERTPRNEA